MNRALISVSDKAGAAELARFLRERGFEILSTGGTAAHLRAAGITVTDVGEVTGFPEILGGRVKTLHPAVHGALLADLDSKEHRAELKRRGIRPIAVVAVNLYPFEQTLRHKGASWEDCLEQIDIGGVSLLRAAAKNHRHVAVLSGPASYAPFMDEWGRTGGLSAESRERLAREAFAHTAFYDAAIASAFAARAGGEESGMPGRMLVTLGEGRALRYGENPHQKAALYAAPGEKPLMALQGKELSFNNFYDMDAAWRLACELPRPACVIVKHGIPCGVALAASPAQAFRKAFDADSESAFGGIVAFNTPPDAKAAKLLLQPFLECVVAPSFGIAARKVLSAKKNLRLVEAGRPEPSFHGHDAKRLSRGWLLQEWDASTPPPSQWKAATKRRATAAQRRELAFAWAVCRHARSNAIVVAKGGVTLGIGAGQTSRVRAVRQALEQAGRKAKGAVLASDGFFPFRDNADAAARAGIAAIVQPGGSMRDAEVVAACERHGIAMLLTGRRHFRH